MGDFDGDEEYRHSRRSRRSCATIRSVASELDTLDLNAVVPAGCEAGVPSFPPAAVRSVPGPGVIGPALETVDEPYARRGSSSSRHSRRRRGLGRGSVEIEDGILTMQTSARSSTTSHEGGEEGGIDTLGIPGRCNATVSG